MLLSFSMPAMLPYIRAGLRQTAGEDVGAVRVKRQTIRALGPRSAKLLEWDPICHSIPYDLHLWWKSRTVESQMIGIARHARVYRIEILHSTVDPLNAPPYQCCRIDGPRGWRDGDSTLFWSPGDNPNGFVEESLADGFDSPEAFRDYFVPNPGARFHGVLFKW